MKSTADKREREKRMVSEMIALHSMPAVALSISTLFSWYI